MSSDECSTPVAGNSSDSIFDEDDADLYEGMTPCFVLGQKLSAHLRETPATHADLGVEALQPYLVNHNGKNYVSIVGDVIMQNNDVVHHVLMIIGPNKVVSVSPDDVYNLWCSLAPPRGFSWRRRAGKIRFSISRIVRRYSNSIPT